MRCLFPCLLSPHLRQKCCASSHFNKNIIEFSEVPPFLCTVIIWFISLGLYKGENSLPQCLWSQLQKGRSQRKINNWKEEEEIVPIWLQILLLTKSSRVNCIWGCSAASLNLGWLRGGMESLDHQLWHPGCPTLDITALFVLCPSLTHPLSQHGSPLL